MMFERIGTDYIHILLIRIYSKMNALRMNNLASQNLAFILNIDFFLLLKETQLGNEFFFL